MRSRPSLRASRLFGVLCALLPALMVPACTDSATSITDFSGIEGAPRGDAPSASSLGMRIVGGNNQSGPGDERLPGRVQVLLVDERGRPVEGVRVYWEVRRGGGSTGWRSNPTLGDGVASNRWTLGSESESQTLRAWVDGGPSVTFRATATDVGSTSDGDSPSGGTLRIHLGDNQSGPADEELSDRVQVLLVDDQGLPVEGTQIFWEVRSGGGSTGWRSNPTLRNGVAANRWTLGNESESQTLRAWVEGGPSVTFRATATDSNASSGAGQVATITASSSQLTLTSLGATRSLSATARDGSGAQLSGVAFGWRSTRTSVATVSTSGRVTARGTGRARIIVTETGVTGGPADTVDVEVTSTSSPDPSNYLFHATFDEGRTVHREMNRDGGGELLIGYSSNGPVNGSYAEPSTNVARSGSHSARLSQAGAGGTSRAIRLQRWADQRSRREVYYSAWFYFPRVYHAQTGGPWGWHNFWQFPTSNSSRDYPLYILGWRNVSPDAMALDLTWWPEAGFGTAGPYRGQNGRRIFRSPVTIPVGQWFQVEARYVCDSGYNGSVQLWLNGREVFNLTNVRTADPNSGSCYTSITNYGANIRESRVDLYVDDFIVSPTRVGRD